MGRVMRLVTMSMALALSFAAVSPSAPASAVPLKKPAVAKNQAATPAAVKRAAVTKNQRVASNAVKKPARKIVRREHQQTASIYQDATTYARS